jgi:hypothetical protein
LAALLTLFAVRTPAKYVSPFNRLSVPEIAAVAPVVEASTLDAGAPVEPAAAVSS